MEQSNISGNRENQVGLFTIGDELLIGQVIDTNSAFLGEELSMMGLTVTEKSSVGDLAEDIKRVASEMCTRNRVVLVTGGLGPTRDDKTKAAICDLLGCELLFNQANWDLIQRIFKKFGREPLKAHYEQCYMPSAVQLLENKMGTAPGMTFDYQGCQFFFMPGVPDEMKYIFRHGVEPWLRQNMRVENFIQETILTVGQGESVLANLIEEIEDNLEEGMSIAYLPGRGNVRVRVSGKGSDRSTLEKVFHKTLDSINEKLEPFVYGYGRTRLEESIGRLLIEHGKTLSVGESCSGGSISRLITSVPGSSQYFIGGVVAYANEIKESVLGVKTQTLIDHGAVSEEVVREMTLGLLEKFKTDIAISVSGVVGPSGGTEEKPVGTVWLCIGDKNTLKTKMLSLNWNRKANIEYTAVYALNMIRKFLSR